MLEDIAVKNLDDDDVDDAPLNEASLSADVMLSNTYRFIDSYIEEIVKQITNSVFNYSFCFIM